MRAISPYGLDYTKLSIIYSQFQFSLKEVGNFLNQ